MNKEITIALRELSNKLDSHNLEETALPDDILLCISNALWELAEELDSVTGKNHDPSPAP